MVEQRAPLLAFYGFHTGAGGIGKVIIHLINVLAEHHRVDILMSRRAGPDIDELAESVRVVELGGRGARGFAALHRYLQNERPDAMVCHREWANRNAALARWLTGVPTRLAFRVGTNMRTQIERRRGPKRWARYANLRWSYPRADVIIANAKGVADEIAGLAPAVRERIQILPNATVPADIESRAGQPAEHPWLEAHELPVLVAVGRLTPAKDYPTLLEAFARLQTMAPARLIILGEGRQRARLEAYVRELGIGDRVDLPGHMPNTYPYLQQADLFVLSSAWEGMPNALIEALATGTPVVATDCRYGPREILANGRYGPLVDVGDAPALAEAMYGLLHQPPPRAWLRRAAEAYHAEAAAQAYRAVLLGETTKPMGN